MLYVLLETTQLSKHFFRAANNLRVILQVVALRDSYPIYCLKNKGNGRVNFRSHAFAFSFSLTSGCLNWSFRNPSRLAFEKQKIIC